MKKDIKKLYIYMTLVSLATAFATLSLYVYTTKVLKIVEGENTRQMEVSKQYIDWAVNQGYIK